MWLPRGKKAPFHTRNLHNMGGHENPTQHSPGFRIARTAHFVFCLVLPRLACCYCVFGLSWKASLSFRTIKTMLFACLPLFFLFAEEVLPKKTENKAPCISFLAAKQLFMLTHGLMKSRKLQVCPQIRNRSACELSILDFDMMHLPQPLNWSSCTSNLTSFSYIYQLQDALRLHPFLFIRGMSGGCLGGPGYLLLPLHFHMTPLNLLIKAGNKDICRSHRRLHASSTT